MRNSAAQWMVVLLVAECSQLTRPQSVMTTLKTAVRTEEAVGGSGSGSGLVLNRDVLILILPSSHKGCTAREYIAMAAMIMTTVHVDLWLWCLFTSHLPAAVEQQHHQPSEAV